MKSVALALLLGPLLVACATRPAGPVPQPLPETLRWARAGAPAANVTFLGLKTRENVGGSFEALEIGRGLKVVRVVENSPAAEAGIRSGDVILGLGGQPLDDPASLEVLLGEARAGEEKHLEVRRGDAVFDVTVRLVEGAAMEESDEASPLYLEDPARTQAAWATGQGGVVLVSAVRGGATERAGLVPGSVVRRLDGEPVVSDRGLLRRVQRADPGTRLAVEYTDPSGAARETTLRLRDVGRRVTRAAIPVLGGYRADLQRDESSFVLLDLWFLSLFRYERQGEEKHWSILRFIRFSTGVGELSE